MIFEKLYKFNFLERIYVNKVLPSTININLTKTNILGKTIRNGKNFYIGQNGKFINSEQLLEKNITTNVFGDFNTDEFLNLQKILKNHQVNFKKIENYFYFKNKRWDLLFSNGVTLKLPSKNIEKSLQIYKQLSNNGNLINTKIIDLRVHNQIVLTNKNE